MVGQSIRMFSAYWAIGRISGAEAGLGSWSTMPRKVILAKLLDAVVALASCSPLPRFTQELADPTRPDRVLQWICSERALDANAGGDKTDERCVHACPFGSLSDGPSSVRGARYNWHLTSDENIHLKEGRCRPMRRARGA